MNTDKKLTFQNDGNTFSALYLAQKWLRENKISAGSLCGDMPVALIRGEDVLVAKWRNLTAKEKAQADGYMESKDFRAGEVTIEMKN